MLTVLALTLVGMLGGIGANAQDRYVSTAGTDAGDCSLPGNPCATINYAISQANGGDEISVADGTYSERVVIDKSLTLTGASEAGTILDGTGLVGNGKGIAINTGIAGVTIQNLTVQDYAGSSGNTDAGIFAIGGNNNLTVQNVTIQNNVGGSGFYANGPVDNVLLDYVTSSGHTVGARGIVIWGSGLKSNITITHCEVFGNNCCGIELQDGTCSGVTMSNNNVYNNGDNGMSAVGLNGSVGANTISNNTLLNNGRFGIEIKNPNGATTVTGNSVTRTAPIGAEVRDIAGIAVMRRGVLSGNVDVPTGVTVTGNTVSGYVQPSTSEGFGIVIGGTNHTVTGNTVTGNDVGIQQQAGHSGYPGDGDQSNLADMYFGRDNSPIACGNTISGNDVATRDVGGPFGNGFVTNVTKGGTFCSIQAAIDNADPGDVLAIASGDYTEDVDATAKAVTLAPGASPGCVTITGNLTLDNDDVLAIEIEGTTACTDYDQFIVTGTVTLGGASLDLTLDYTPSGSDLFTIIDGSNLISGVFSQMSTITVPGAVFIISYTGGDGNDVVLQRDCGDVCVGDVIRTGNVTLSTQTQVNAFLSAGCKYTQITGNLTITGYNGSSDPITNLCNLSELVSVGGTVTIRDFNNAANPTNLNDLASLATIGDGVGTDNLVIGGSVGDQNSSFDNITLAGLMTVGNGSVTINNNPNVTTISLPALNTVGATTSHNLTVGTNGTGVTSINLPALTTVSGDVTMNNAVTHLVSAAVNLGNLTTVGDDMNLTRTAGSLNISSLETVDALTISTNNLTALNPTALTAVGAFAITSNTMLTSINSAPASFTAISLSVTGNTTLQTATIGVSATTGNVTISSNGTGVTAITLNNLGTVGGNLDMNNTTAGNDVSATAAVSLNALTSVTGLFRMVRAANSVTAPNLENVGGAFTFQRNGVTDLDAAFPEPLLTIGGNLNVTNNASLSQCCIIPCQLTVLGSRTVSGNIGNCATLLIATNICKPTVFTVSAGAPGCTGTVNLDGSQNGVEYELYVDEFGTPVATGITQTGNGVDPVSFTGIEFGGDYTVVAALASGCTASMTGTVTVVPDFDLVVEAPTSAACGETITVTVKAGACGVKELGSIQFAMQWAATDFEYVSGSEMPAALLPTANVTVAPPPGNLPNTLRFGWIAPGSEVDIEAGDVLLTFQLKSKISTGSSTVDLIALDAGDLEAMQSNFYVLTLPANTSDAVVFGSKPGYSVVIDGPANPVCPNTSISLSANVTGGAPGFAYTWDPNIGSSQAPAAFTHTGTTTYTVTVTDDDGCTTSATREVKDNEAPTIVCPTDMTLTRDTDDDECTYTAVGTEFDPTFDDNCTATIAYELTGATTGDGMTTLAGVVFEKGETTVTWTVTDNSGNATVCSYVVSVEDNEDPTITICPTNQMETAPVCAYETVGTEFDATFDDNCSATIAYELTGATLGSGATTLAGVEFNRGETIVTWTVTDASSNSTSCSFTVTVDGDTPEITTTVQGTTLNNLNGPNTLTIQVCNENNTVTGTALTQLEMPMLPNVNVLIQITDSENINLASGAPAGDTERLDDLLPDGLDGPIGTTGATWQNYIDDVRLQTATQWGFVEITITPYTDLDVSGDFTAGDCLGTPIVVTIQVQPLPGATSAFVSPTAQDGAICSEELVEVNLGVNGFQLIGGGVPTPADYDYVVTQVRYSIDNGATYPVGNSGYPAGLTPGVDYVTNPLITGTQLMESLTNTTNDPIYLRYQLSAKLTNAPECGGSNTVTIRVVINPLPELTAQEPEICESANPFDLTSLKGDITSATGTFAYEFAGDPVADPTMFTAADGDVVNVTFTETATGCENTTTITFTVNPLPVLTAQTPAICTDENPFDLTTLESAITSATGTFAYEFGGNSVPDATMFTAVNGNVVNVTFTETATGCKNTTTITFTVIQTPDVDDIADLAACATYTLPTITGTNLSGNEAYYTGTGGTGTQYNAGDAITTTTTLYIYDETGTTPNCSDEESFVITIVNPITDLTMTVVPSGDVCVGATGVQYEAVVTGGTGPFTYAWCAYTNGAGTGTCNGGFSPGGNSATQTRNWTSAGARSVRVTVSQDVCPDQEELYVFNVTADPVAPTLATATPDISVAVCEGETASATFNAGSGGTGTCTDEYQVSTDNGDTWDPYTPGAPITALEETIIVQGRRVCDGLGCDGSGETFVTLATWSVNLTPDVSVSFSETEICAGDAVTLTFTDIAATGHTFSIAANLTDIMGTNPVTFTGVTDGAMATYTEGVEFTGSATLSDIVVTDDMTGCTVEYDDISVTVNPLPVMTCPADITTVCLNDAAFDLTTLTPTPDPAGGTFSGDGVTGDMFDPIAAGLGVTTITYTVTDVENCSNTCAFDITVNANPSKAFRAAGTNVSLPFVATLDFDTDHEICAGGVVEYGAEAAVLDGNTYVWSIAPAMGATILQGADARNVQVEWTTAGTYTLTFVVTNTNGCTSTNSLEVTVNANPTAAISPDPAAVCAGIDLALNGNPTGGSGTYTTHEWTGAGAASLDNANIQEPTFNAAAGEYELTYTVTDDNGCKGSDNITVTVNANPTAAISPDPAAVCAGFDLALDGNPTGGSETYTTHEWTDAGATSLDDANIQEPTFNNAVAGPYALIYTVTDDNGCKGSDDITVTVNANPTNAFRPVGDAFTSPFSGTITHDADHEICAGSTANYGAAATVAAGHTYLWSVSGGSLLTSATLRNVQVQWAASGTLTLTVTHTATGCTSTNTIDVTVNPLPVMTCPDDITVCEDADPIDLATLTPAPAPEGGIFTGTGVDMDGMFTPPSGDGVYTITYTYTDGNSCTNTCTFTITVNALPVTTCPDDITVCENEEAFDLTTLMPTANPAGGTFTSNGDGITGNMFDPSEAGAGIHTITYTYTDGNSCTGTCEFDITVKEQPKLTATLNTVAVTADNDGKPDVGAFSVCDGGSVEITANFSDAAGLSNVRIYQTVTLTNTTFGWCNNCQAPLGIFVTPTASPITLVNPYLPGTAVITFQAWQDDDNDGVIDMSECIGDVIEYTITVNALPVISFGFNGVEAGHNASFEYCYDEEVEVTLHTEYAGMAPYSVTYTTNGGSTTTVTGLSTGGVITASQLYAPGVYNIVVTNITDAKGCEASPAFLSLATATVTIHPAPSNAFRPVGEAFTSPFSGNITHDVDHEICAGSKANYGAVAAGGHTYLWSVTGAGNTLSTFATRNVQVQWATSGTLTLVVTNTATGCTSTNSIDVTVNPLPVMTCPTSPVNACTGTPLTLTGGLPTGGTYSGGGVSGGSFDPDEVSGPGPHTVFYTVTDMKGCVNSCSFDVIINDLPEMTCPSDFTVCEDDAAFALTGASGLPAGGTGVYTGDGVTDNAFDPAVAGDGTHTITYTYTDLIGCVNTCTFDITVNPCVTISGKIIWKGNGVTGVNLVNVALTGSGSDMDVTDVDGKYTLQASMGGNFTVTPTKYVNMFNGVTGADATAIQQHLTGSPLITDFFRLLAADVNKSNSVSSVDAAIINQALLGNPAAVNIMNNTGSWRFVRTDYIYPIPAGPFTLPSFMLYDKRLVSTMMNLPGQDFYGVKTGDVVEQEFPGPGPGIANPELKPDPSVKPLVWRVRDRMLKTGETVELDFSVTNFTDIAAFQHGMRFDPSVLQYQNVTITGTGIPMNDESNFGAYQVAAGELRTLWSVAQGVTLPGVQPMYRVRFTVLRGGMKLSEIISLDPAVLSAVAYTTDLTPREVQLVFADYKNSGGLHLTDLPTDVATGFDLLQNRPNPFSDRTTIGFILPEACDAQLRVFDISGRELWRSDKSYPAGYNEEVLRLNEIDATGMLYYELTTPQGKQTRKMMAVRM